MADSIKKPRLLVVTSTYPRWKGDTEPPFVHQLASRLTGRFDVTVVTSRSPGARTAEVMDGVHVRRYAYAPASWETLIYGGGLVGNLHAAPWKVLLLPTYLLCWAWQVAKITHQRDFDVVHAHWFVPGAIVAALAARNIPMCVTAHGTDVLGLQGKRWRRLRKFIATRASAITTVGNRIQSTLAAEGITPTKLLPMGVDFSKTFVKGIPKAHSSRILCVGRLAAAKRPEIALKAFSQALHVHPALTLDMIGNGPAQRSLESLAEELGIMPRVIFHGRKSQTEIASMYRSAAAVIIASGGDEAPEGLGLVAIEALGCGCPVISAPNVALLAALPDTAPIYYARDSSSDALAEALLKRLAAPLPEPPDAGNPPWHDQLIQKFGWESVADEYERTLNSLIPEHDLLK